MYNQTPYVKTEDWGFDIVVMGAFASFNHEEEDKVVNGEK
jgi:hypothetical protein